MHTPVAPSHVPRPAQSPGQRRCAQLGPVHPATHAHVPLRQTPRRWQSISSGVSHVASEQSAPVHPAAHAQMPSAQRPCPEQSFGHSRHAQCAPPKPDAHTHVPLAQRPRGAAHSAAHSRASHCGPPQPFSHTQPPSGPQTPCTQPAHVGTLQSSPAQPAAHSQPFAVHVPRPEHSFGQTRRWHATPAKPSSQPHRPR